MTVASSTEKYVTKEEFERIPDAFKRFEVEYGKLVEVEPLGRDETIIQMRLALAIGRYLDRPDTDELLGSDMRYRLSRNPDLIRGCDVAYIPIKRQGTIRPQMGILDCAPLLAIEVVSPSNPAVKVNEKIHEWFAAGVERLWVVYPTTGTIQDYESPTKCRILKRGDSLDGGTILPGFQFPLDTVFA